MITYIGFIVLGLCGHVPDSQAQEQLELPFLAHVSGGVINGMHVVA